MGRRGSKRRSHAGRAGLAVRQRIRDLRREVFRAFGTPIAAMCAVLAVVAVPTVWMQNTSFMSGFVAAVFLAVAVFFPFYVLAINGVLARSMGADAEKWTSGELRKLDRRQWFVLDDLLFGRANVDHIVVGPGRQVYAVESKWCSLGVRLEPMLDRWFRQTRRGAEKVRLLLKSEGVQRQVTPVLIIWGPGHSIGGQFFVERDGVLVATGRGVDALVEELRRRSPGMELDYPTCRALEAFGIRQDAATAKSLSA